MNTKTLLSIGGIIVAYLILSKKSLAITPAYRTQSTMRNPRVVDPVTQAIQMTGAANTAYQSGLFSSLAGLFGSSSAPPSVVTTQAQGIASDASGWGLDLGSQTSYVIDVTQYPDP